MGKIEIDHTGSGGGITLSSDGTSLLLGGTAIGGGGGADLYAANPSSATDPTANGLNSIAIGDGMTTGSSAVGGIAIGQDGTVSGTNSVSLGKSGAYGTGSFAAAISSVVYQTYGADGDYSISVGYRSRASSSGAIAIGYEAKSLNNYSTAISRSYASGADSFAAAIADNTSSYGATGANSIAIGYQAKAFNTYSVAIGRTAIAGGDTALALGEAKANGVRSIAIGTTTSSGKGATGLYAIAIGYNSASTGTGSVCLGPENTSSSQYSVAIGRYASSAVEGKLAYSAGRFAAAGDAQGGQFILRADTTDATATVLTTNNSTAASTNQIVAASDTCITFDGTITAMQNGAQAYASWKIEGLLVNDGGTTTLANSATTVISNSSSWGMALSADTGNNALAITVTGEASHNIRWVANIRTTEVTYA